MLLISDHEGRMQAIQHLFLLFVVSLDALNERANDEFQASRDLAVVVARYTGKGKGKRDDTAAAGPSTSRAARAGPHPGAQVTLMTPVKPMLVRLLYTEILNLNLLGRVQPKTNDFKKGKFVEFLALRTFISNSVIVRI
jgi:hypothetical protein